MIKEHIALLVRSDPFFRAYWESLVLEDQDRLVELTRQIEDLCCGTHEELLIEHRWISEKARRYLSCVPEKDFDFRRLPHDWIEFVGDEEGKTRIYEIALEKLVTFIGVSSARGKSRVYGGLKSVASLDASFVQPKANSAHRRGFRDTWDAVRFRIVCSDLIELRTTCIEIWQHFMDEVMRCRNYYVSVADGDSASLYRAVHFQLEITLGRCVEVQVVTELREWLSFLDHSFFFKKHLTFDNSAHKKWLTDLSLKANISDGRKIPETDLKIPLDVVQRLKPCLM